MRTASIGKGCVQLEFERHAIHIMSLDCECSLYIYIYILGYVISVHFPFRPKIKGR